MTGGYYLCSDFLCDLLDLDGDTISFSDFLNLVREDYRCQIAHEFRANSSIHKDFYEQTFPIYSKYGEVWLHTVWLPVRKERGLMGETNLLE